MLTRVPCSLQQRAAQVSSPRCNRLGKSFVDRVYRLLDWRVVFVRSSHSMVLPRTCTKQHGGISPLARKGKCKDDGVTCRSEYSSTFSHEKSREVKRISILFPRSFICHLLSSSLDLIPPACLWSLLSIEANRAAQQQRWIFWPNTHSGRRLRSLMSSVSKGGERRRNCLAVAAFGREILTSSIRHRSTWPSCAICPQDHRRR